MGGPPLFTKKVTPYNNFHNMTKKKSFVFFRVGVDSIQKTPIFVQQQRGTIPQQQTPNTGKTKRVTV